MYEQQLKYLPGQRTPKQVFEHIKQILNPNKLALIIHDHDENENGNPVEEHIHAMMRFSSPRHLTAIAKSLGEIDANGKPKTQQLTAWRSEDGNGFAYLCHKTAKAMMKYQYNPADVIADFDYPAWLEAETKKVELAGTKINANIILNDLYNGGISYEDATNILTGSQYGRMKKQLDNVLSMRRAREAEEWRKKAVERGETVKLIWVYGLAGAGKTSFAKDYAKRTGQPYYITGSSRDLFQGYAGEHTIILDELRPGTIRYDDFLRITDPHNLDAPVMAPSRYSDKPLACSLYIVTSPYDPYQFFQKSVSYDGVDRFSQLLRRITLTIIMGPGSICRAKYDKNGEKYWAEIQTKKDNPYCNSSTPQTVIDEQELYDEIFE